jgi:hypothetical protein
MTIQIPTEELKAQIKELAAQIELIKNLPIFAGEEIPLSLKEIQTRGGPGVKVLRQLIRTGELKAHQLTNGGKWYVYPKDLKNCLNSY